MRALLSLALAAICVSCGGSYKPCHLHPCDRGSWFWSDPRSAYGSNDVVGSVSGQALAFDQIKSWGIQRIYGWYDADAEVVASWNAALYGRGIASLLLLGQNRWFCHRDQLFAQLEKRLLSFNENRPAAQRFVGIHIDLEPHSLRGGPDACGYDWDNEPLEQKRALLSYLANLFSEVRARLDDAGAKTLPIYASLPVWFDNVVTSARFHWQSPKARDDWFATVAQALKGVTLMAYCRDSQAEVRRSVDWEVDNFKGEVRIGLNLHERPGAKNECHTWTSNQHLLSVAEQLEAHHGPSVGIDLQSFTRLLEDYQDRR